MRIGYACKTIGVPNTAIGGCTLKNASEDRLNGLIQRNLHSLHNLIAYNVLHEIRMFRICSDIIPFASHPKMTIPWTKEFEQEIAALGKAIKQADLRVSMHPGQYTVLNSAAGAVVDSSILDIEYHCAFLDLLNVDLRHKVILHIGSMYEGKAQAMKRFEQNFLRLSDSAKKRIVLENDDKCYTVEELLSICQYKRIPAVYDVLHNRVNPANTQRDDAFWIEKCAQTWTQSDGSPKVHYSQQSAGGKAGAHSASIGIDAFLRFYDSIQFLPVDIMLEVKDKNLSALKCMYCTRKDIKIAALTKEWERYKYFVLSRSHQIYETIGNLLKDKANPQPAAFYRLIESALCTQESLQNEIAAASHVWSCFKMLCSEMEKRRILKLIDEAVTGNNTVRILKANLLRLAEKYTQEQLVESLYFYL